MGMVRSLAVLLFLLPAGGQDPHPVDSYFDWKKSAPICDDAVFLRRATLDLCGRIPTADEIRAFLKHKDRAKAVDALLASDDAAMYHADLWYQWLFDYDFEARDMYTVDFSAFHGWLQAQFKADTPYPEFVRALLADRGKNSEKPAVNFAIRHLRVNEPPVKLAVLSARLFNGKDIRCAQCHDHPSDDSLKHADFWGYTAFFRPLAISNYGLVERETQSFRGMIADHLGELREGPKWFDGARPEKDESMGDALARLTLAAGVSRALVDRYWRLFFGRTPPPKLAEALAADFEKNGSRFKHLLRRIALSKAYQLSSVGSEEDRAEYRVGPIKGMNLVQFLNSFADAFDLHKYHEEMFQRGLKDPKTMEIFKDRIVMRAFFHKWSKDMVLPKGADPDATNTTGTVRLAMKFMNNEKIQSMVFYGWGRLKEALGKKSRPADRVEFLFLTLLGRFPRAGETERFVEYIESAAIAEKAYEDIFWVLVNSAEFLFVH